MSSVRGSRIANSLFGDDDTTLVSSDSRGRSAELIDARNTQILYTLCWYKMDTKLDYNWIIKQISGEFYLAESTIGQIIEASYVELRKISNEWKAAGNDEMVKMLKKRYERWKW